MPDVSHFPIRSLKEFDFGDAEGQDDELLDTCLCETAAVSEFLRGKKSIVLGPRGSGKTALFTLLRRGVVSFRDRQDKKQLLVPISQDLQFRILKDQVIEKLTGDLRHADWKYRFVWEAYLINEILYAMEVRYGKLSKLKEIRKEFETQLQVNPQKRSITDFLSGGKLSAGIKFGDLDKPTPSFTPQLSVESVQSEPASIALNDLARIRDQIDSLLRSEKEMAVVLIDKLDEFVANDEIETQRHTLEGLLACQKGYANSHSIEIKLFLRTDLFDSLDLGTLGVDKIEPKVIRLRWEKSETSEFVAKRLIFNLQKSVGSAQVKHLMQGINVTALDSESFDWHASLNKKITRERLIAAFCRLFRIKQNGHGSAEAFLKELDGKRDRKNRRIINFNDELNEALIALVFPTVVEIPIGKGQTENISIFEFMNTRLSLSHGTSTPRVLLLYLDKLLDVTRKYYAANDDVQSIPLVGNNFAIFKIEFFDEAKRIHAHQLWANVSRLSISKTDVVNQFQQRRKAETQFSFRDIGKLSGLSDEDDIKDFIKFMLHAGVFICYQTALRDVERRYSIAPAFIY